MADDAVFGKENEQQNEQQMSNRLKIWNLCEKDNKNHMPDARNALRIAKNE